MSEATQAVLDRLRRLVDDQEGGDAVVLVQRQLFNRTVGRIEAQAKEIDELKAALAKMEMYLSRWTTAHLHDEAYRTELRRESLQSR